MVVISVYTYGVKIIKKFQWESGFLWGGFHGTPPLCTNGSAGNLMQLSVKRVKSSLERVNHSKESQISFGAVKKSKFIILLIIFPISRVVVTL